MSRTENCEWCLTPHDPVETDCPDDDSRDIWRDYDDPAEWDGDMLRCDECGNWHNEEECP